MGKNVWCICFGGCWIFLRLLLVWVCVLCGYFWFVG